MVHTFELSKMISKKKFDTIIKSLGIRLYRHSCWVTSAYANKGFQLIRLYKFQRKDITAETEEDSDLTHHYMIALSINTAKII